MGCNAPTSIRVSFDTYLQSKVTSRSLHLHREASRGKRNDAFEDFTRSKYVGDWQSDLKHGQAVEDPKWSKRWPNMYGAFCNQQRSMPLNEEKYFWAFFGQRIPGISFNLHHLWPIFNIPPGFLQRRSGTTRQSTPEPTRMGRSMAREGRTNISNIRWGDIMRYQQYCSVCIRKVHHISFWYLSCQVWMAWWFCVWRGVPQQQCGESQSYLNVSSNRSNLVQPWSYSFLLFPSYAFNSL